MEHIGQLFSGYEFVSPNTKGRVSERGCLVDYFAYKVNQGRSGKKDKKGKSLKPVSKSFVSMQLAAIRLTVSDLYYLKSVGEDYERHGKPWGKFYWAIVRTEKTEDPEIRQVMEDLSLSTE